MLNSIVRAKGPSSSLAMTCISDVYSITAPPGFLPNVQVIARRIRRIRESFHPKHPNDLDFDLDEQQFPDGFLTAECGIQEDGHFKRFTFFHDIFPV